MSAYLKQLQADGAIGYWPMDEGSGTTVKAAIGGNNGTYTGSPPWVASHFGQAPDFSAQGRYATIPFSTLSSYQQCTVEFWYKASSYASSYYTLVAYTPNINTNNGILFSLTGGQASYCGLHSFSNNGALANECRWPQSNLPLNQWNHVMFWLNRGIAAGGWKLYVNGVVATGIIQGNGNSQATNFTSSNFYVASVDGSTNFQPCYAQHLSVFPTDVTANAKQHYGAGIRSGVNY